MRLQCLILLSTVGLLQSLLCQSVYVERADRVAMRGYFAEKLGVLVAVGLPSDQPKGLSLEWREGPEHVKDISAVMDVMMKQYPAARITVLGFSNGCRSAAHIAAAARKRWGGSLGKVVMLSC